MKIVAVDKAEDFWDVNMANSANLSTLHDQTGHIDAPQRVAFRGFLVEHDVWNLLDCGAGPGWEFDGIERDGLNLVYDALEITEIFAQALERRGIKVTRAGIERIPARDNYYDLVYQRHVIEHVNDARCAIREMIRVARRFVYIALNKPLGAPTRSVRHGLPHNTYSGTELRSAMRCDKVERVEYLKDINTYRLFLKEAN